MAHVDRATPRQHLAFDAGALSLLVGQTRERCATSQDVTLETLREAILTGLLGEGTRLRQEDLAHFLHTSRVTVREALRALEYEGLVSSEPRRGFSVAT